MSLVVFIVASVLCSTQAAIATQAQLEVAPRSELTEIGKDLLLEVSLTPPAGSALVAGSVEVVATVAGEDALLDEAYPLQATTEAEGGFFRGKTTFEWAAPVLPDAQPASRDIELRVSYQLDTSSEVQTATWQGTLTVDFGEEWTADKITDFISRKGIIPFLVIVFGFGLLMSLSPCIYPMIPITLAVIGTQSQEKGVAHGLMLSVTYVIGLALVYAIMGALSATVFSGITAFMQSPPILIPIAVLMLVLSFGMFGAFELQAPAFLRDRLQGPGASKGGLVGVFVMGMVAGLVASPCVGPFLAALLVWVATTGKWFLGFWTLFVFGIGMGMLLMAVGTFPGMMKSLPQSGGWMESIKKGMGLLLVAMAFYFVRPGMVLPETVFFILLGIATILAAIYIGAFDNVAPGCHWWDRARKGIGLIALVFGLYFLGGTLLQKGFLLPPFQTAGAAGVAMTDAGHVAATTPAASDALAAATAQEPKLTKVPWTKIHTGENVRAFLDGKIEESKATGKPIMIDFWANWCKICKILDKKVWNQAPVVEESKRFIVIKVDATESDDEMAAIWEEYRIGGLPAIIFIDSRGKVLHGRTVSGFKSPEEMLEVMQGIR